MKNFFRILRGFLKIGMIMWCFVSCINDVMEIENTEETTTKTCELRFNVSCTDFESNNSRTATSTTWIEGDKVYLTFKDDAYGVATYQSGNWSVEFYGTLMKDHKSICKAVFFSNPKSREEFQAVNLTHETAIYEDTCATYLYDGSLITITANLQPKTGRMRFMGNYRDTVRVYGLQTNTRYSVYKGEYTDTVRFIELVAKADGYTPYIYGVFVDTIERRLNVATSKSAYTRVFDNSVMNSGQSGWLSIPTDVSHNAWKEKMIFKVSTTEFAMMPVTVGGFLSFLIGETEVTKGLYNALTDTVIVKSDYPQTFLNYDDCTALCDSLKLHLGVNFSLPTETQWKFAYKGGEKSQNYKYSGSNTASEVAWFNDNSGGNAHKVATLMPNELGIYDMSGNLSEWICTTYWWPHYSWSSFTTTATFEIVESVYSVFNVGCRLTLSFK